MMFTLHYMFCCRIQRRHDILSKKKKKRRHDINQNNKLPGLENLLNHNVNECLNYFSVRAFKYLLTHRENNILMLFFTTHSEH
jgi:hypothetical protein